MSLKAIWKKRALDNLTALPQDTNGLQLDEYGVPMFVPKSFETIRREMGEALKQRLPQAAQAIDDPTSVFSMLLDSIAAVDLDQYKQMEALATFIKEKGVKLK